MKNTKFQFRLYHAFGSVYALAVVVGESSTVKHQLYK